MNLHHTLVSARWFVVHRVDICIYICVVWEVTIPWKDRSVFTLERRKGQPTGKPTVGVKDDGKTIKIYATDGFQTA